MKKFESINSQRMRPSSARPQGSTPRSIYERRLGQQTHEIQGNFYNNHSPQKMSTNALTPQVSRRREQSIQAAILRGSNTAGITVRKGNGAPHTIDEQTARTAWRAFGSYIAKQLLNGKGVVVPKFGTFSFTAMNVDLGGTTNPQQRDKQLREPVFMVGKDFVSNIVMKRGIAHTWGDIRPFDLKGANGIIPQVKINWIEVATFGGMPKETAREACDQMFRQMADQLRNGKAVNAEIPLVGRFVTRGTIAAIAFLPSLTEQTLGATAKQFSVGKLFASSNTTLNLNIHKEDDNKQNAKFMNGGTLGVQDDAAGWLKNNLDIDLEAFEREPQGDFPQNEEEDPHDVYHPGKVGVPIGPKSLGRTLSGARGASRQYLPNRTHLTASSKEGLDRHPPRSRSGLALSRPPSAGGYSGVPSSHITVLPNVDRVGVMAIASQLYACRKAIMAYTASPASKTQLRDLLTSSQIHAVLRKCGCYLEIVSVKVLLKELGFPYNGAAASFTSLLIACRAFLHGNGAGVGGGNGLRSAASMSAFSGHPAELRMDQAHADGASPTRGNAKKVIHMLRDLLYSTRKNLYELFRTGDASRKTLDLSAFKGIIDFASKGNVAAGDAETAFSHLVHGTGEMTFEVFERAFRSEVPTGVEFETVVIRRVREWMFRNRLSSEMAFESLCRASGRFSERTMPRASFHEGFQHYEISLSAAQIDALFSSLSGGKTEEISLSHWQSRIYEDGDNPLQAMRETVTANRLSQDDLMFTMKLRVWDDPLDGHKFLTAIRLLDATVSDAQAKSLFSTLKNNDGKVDVHVLVRNLTGKEFETVDFRNKIFAKIYAEVFPNKEEKMIQLLQEEDTENMGLIRGAQLLRVLNSMIISVSKADLERFVRFLEKDKLGKIPFMEFMGRMGKANKTHNPFKTIVSRIAFFLKQNNVEIPALLSRLAQSIEGSLEKGTGNWAIPCDGFTAFLKQKVEKKRDVVELRKFTMMIDIDKDGFITDPDLSTCVKNLNNSAFWRKGGEALTRSSFNQQAKPFPKTSRLGADKAKQIVNQIRAAMGTKQISYRTAFDSFDLNKDGMVSFAEFQRGVQDICAVSQPILEQLYALMDTQRIGLVSYQNFLAVLKDDKFEPPRITDNFDWEYSCIKKIQSWIADKKYTVEEAFKCFDSDFDGYISKADLKSSLSQVLEIPPAEIFSTKLDRLYSLIDFFKQGKIQLSDFQRLLKPANPYTTTAVTGATNKMSRSLGGGLHQTSTFNWKFSAVQQLGLVSSKKYATPKQSFAAASGGNTRLNYGGFKTYVDTTNALEGFNLTEPLLQKLFAELDAHKKGYLDLNDWNSAFGTFKWSDQLLVELKNILQCSFADSESAYNFFITFKEAGKKGKGAGIQSDCFSQAVHSLTSGRFKKGEIHELWLTLASKNGLDLHAFRAHFDTMVYTGKSQIKTVKALAGGAINSSNAPLRGASSTKAGRTTVQTVTSSSEAWEADVVEKLRQIVKSSSMSLRQIFNGMDADGNGFITQVEFRNAIRQLGLGLTSREIDQLLAAIDSNADGKIDWTEFASKFKSSELEERMADRARARMGQLKELMILHMTSPNDAFRFYDVERDDRLTFKDFSNLVTKVHQLGSLPVPAYPVLKDLFDVIDIRQDGLIDLTEWQQTFGRVTDGGNQLSIKPTSLTTWENSAEYEQIGTKIAKNRKQLIEQFKKVLGSKDTRFTFQQGKDALDAWLQAHFQNTIDDEKLKCVFRAAQVHSIAQGQPQYDYQRLFDIFKGRHARPQF